MNYRRQLVASLITFGIAAFTYTANAQNMDVDQADTIDFQSFHKDKKEAIKAWDKNSTTTTKAYDDTSVKSSATEPNKSATPAPASAAAPVAAPTAATAAAVTPAQIPAGAKGKRFEIRERYTLTRSTKTPYSAFYVNEPLYKQAATLCPLGWKKLAERSEPVEDDFYLYFEVECL